MASSRADVFLVNLLLMVAAVAGLLEFATRGLALARERPAASTRGVSWTARLRCWQPTRVPVEMSNENNRTVKPRVAGVIGRAVASND